MAPKISEDNLPGDESLKTLKQAYVTHCSACHPLIHPAYFERTRAIDRFTRRYRDQRIINELESKEVEAYIRALAATR